MSYVGSDDMALCDGPCNSMYPPGPPAWPDWVTPWPVHGPLWDANGRMTSERRDNFHICWACLRELILKARLPLDGRELAQESAERWRRSQRLLDQAEDVVKGPPPRSPGRIR